MLKKIFFMLMGVAIALAVGLLQMSPANATVNNVAVYTWGYANQTRVCKQIDVTPHHRPTPRDQDKQPLHLKSRIVSDRYCQK
ncbi:MAG: hypothetical protein SAJ12_18715 [Jaaginema sp. PMC 1079.18]|nr:hypothetical protein [Jaaginema sp. PMC 1080.18]MEC4853019.1 hypothetical protein [Jaaginema sp. PMC 1079.18]MEC4866239.1 hypothetical protein [Jaaginema sp. PMC 1078.18]